MAERIKQIKNLAIVLREDDGSIGINIAKDLRGNPIGIVRMTEQEFSDLVDGLNEARKLIQRRN